MPASSFRKLFIGGIAAFTISAAFPLLASANDMGIIRVESTTIDDKFTSKRGEPSNTGFISGEEVDNAHTENIQQLLQGIPGVTTEVQSGDSLKIHIRGMENQAFMGERPGVAVVIDGVPVFERTGRVNIDLDNIESIKVIKGGASYLFGDDALSGAVIITTKRGAKMAGYKLATELGSFNYKKVVGRAGISTDNFNGYLQASTRTSDGYHFDSGYQAKYLDGKLQYYLTDDSDLTFGFETADRKKDSHGSVTGVTQASNDPTSVEGRDYARMFDVQLQKFFLTYSKDMGENNNLLLNVYQFSDHTKYFSAPQYFTAARVAVTDVDAYTISNNYKQVQRGLKGEWRSSNKGFAYLAAFDVRSNTYTNKQAYAVDFRRSASFAPWNALYTAGTVTADNVTAEKVVAMYGELKYQATDDLTLTMNGRYDYIHYKFSEQVVNNTLAKGFSVPSWRAGLNYALQDNIDIYSNVSTGFRTPTVNQLFAGDITINSPTASNPDLKPEQTINYEIGLRSNFDAFGVGMSLDVAAFQMDRNDYIIAASGLYSKTAPAINKYENIGKVRNRGLEVSLTSDATKPLSFNAAYTYLDAKFLRYENFNLVYGNIYANPVVSSAYNNSGNTVPRVPKHHLNLKVTALPLPGLTVTGEMDAISSYWADEVNLHQIAAHKTFNLLVNYDHKTKNYGTWSIFGRVDNALDTRYYNTARSYRDANEDNVYNSEDFSIVVNPGRSFAVGITATF